MQEENLGWQQAPGMKKFHYFGKAKLALSLCRKWMLDRMYESDTKPPKYNGEECISCCKEWEKTYGSSKEANA